MLKKKTKVTKKVTKKVQRKKVQKKATRKPLPKQAAQVNKKLVPIVPVFDEIRAIVKNAKPFVIVKGATYLYFSVQPSQEAIVFQHILKRKRMNVTSVYNYKDSIIGYLVEFREKPYLEISKNAEGAGIFFTNKAKHAPPKIAFADQKLRVLSFSDEDFFISVKWKSNVSVDE